MIFRRSARQGRFVEGRKEMTNGVQRLSLSRQAHLLWISRGSLYYARHSSSEGDLKLMREIDELHMDYPFAGSQMTKGDLTIRALKVTVVLCRRKKPIITIQIVDRTPVRLTIRSFRVSTASRYP